MFMESLELNRALASRQSESDNASRVDARYMREISYGAVPRLEGKIVSRASTYQLLRNRALPNQIRSQSCQRRILVVYSNYLGSISWNILHVAPNVLEIVL